ncbi:serine protease inhibitor [Synechococcus sp. CS-205]|uniref:serine protease inhibitor n=1 Tax=Synechococcus sp. CS-205 TaxID=2847984 RepID=UPI00223A84BC|nr:serine protease inhibitor [Synechococcus sp. CS-205]MCT0248922.1 serine protease inhibitor [Synechococcus sp. CS-205]
MAASCFSTPRSLSSSLVRPGQVRPWSRPRVLGAFPLLVVVLVLTAALVAPEQPEQLGAICARHHGPEACRVW